MIEPYVKSAIEALNDIVLDTHGLYSEEACDMLDEFMENWKREIELIRRHDYFQKKMRGY